MEVGNVLVNLTYSFGLELLLPSCACFAAAPVPVKQKTMNC